MKTIWRPLGLVTLYMLVVLSPLFLAWAQNLPPRAFRNEVASGLGLLAFSIILVEFVLSGRFKSISSDIGMDITMRFHQLMARTAMAMALVHPFFYSSWIGQDRPWDPSGQLGPASSFAELWTGIFAFLILPTFVLIAIARRQLDFRYEVWRGLHGIGAALIAIATLLHAIDAGRYSTNPALTNLWFGLTAIALGSLLFVYILKPLWQTRRPWAVKSIARLAPHQWGVTITPEGHNGIDYKAGQFVWLNLGHSPFSLQEHPFSISSAPADGNDLSFIIKELGDFTSTLDQIKPGTKAYIDGPFGHLTVDNIQAPGIALIAGGVGIAPLLGILRQLSQTNTEKDVTLIYANSAKSQIVFEKEIAQHNKAAQIDAKYILSDPQKSWKGDTGWVDRPYLERNFKPEQLQNWVFLLCGPPAMMDAVEHDLIALGTPAAHIVSERFSYD